MGPRSGSSSGTGRSSGAVAEQGTFRPIPPQFLEPRTVTPRILRIARRSVDPPVSHIQIPLQSGSDRVLARMSRNYRTATYRRLIETAVTRVPDICLGADVITGFPGETEEDHAATLSFLSALPLAYLHVFSFSPSRHTCRDHARRGREHHRSRPHQTTDCSGPEMKRAFRLLHAGPHFSGCCPSGSRRTGLSRTLTGNYIEVLYPIHFGT